MTATAADEKPLVDDLAGLWGALHDLVRATRMSMNENEMPVLCSVSEMVTDSRLQRSLLNGANAHESWASFAGEQGNLVALGTAAHVANDENLEQMGAAWRSLMTRAVRDDLTERTAGPVVVFGRSFQDQLRRTPAWRSFGNSRAFVPSLCVRQNGNGDLIATASALTALVPLLPRARAVSEEVPHAPASKYADAVRTAVVVLNNGGADKVVLSRAVRLISEERIDPLVVLARLDELYPGTCRYAVSLAASTFLGATPELLCSTDNKRLRTMSLAGSVPLHVDDITARSDPKLAEEHAIVTDRIVSVLGPLSTHVSRAREPEVVKLRNIKHLRTNIEAELRPGMSLFDVAHRLHPTPAVCGLPALAARKLIDELESVDRGWYSGVVGWVNAHGDGSSWVALRCALVSGKSADLFAGAGIVRESDPDAELAETELKLRAMYEALG